MELAPIATSTAIPALPEGWNTIGYSILSDGSLAILGANIDLLAEWRRDKSGQVLGRPLDAAAAADAKIWTFDGRVLVEGPQFRLLTPFPVIDRLTDGRWLVASVRSLETPNARILSSAGSELHRIHLGDGIQHMKVDHTDNVWVGWFDEGVFGNDDWRVQGHEWAPSNYGLVAFDLRGAIVTYAKPLNPELLIADCYALNVSSSSAYACTYPDFPIIELSTSSQTWRPSDLSGTRALAVRLPYVLAAGGYGNEGDRAVLLRVEAEGAQALKVWRMPLLLGFPEGVSLVDGRGDSLHVVQNQVWHRWTIETFIADAHLS